MSVTNHHIAELSVSDDSGTAPLAAPQALHPRSIAWLDWCYRVIDRAFGFDLRDEELRQLLGPEHRRR